MHERLKTKKLMKYNLKDRKNMIDQLKEIITNNKKLFENIIGAFVVKGGSLIVSVVLLPLYLRFFGDQTVLGIWYTILSILIWV